MSLKVFNAANTQIPAYLVLIDKGFAVRCERSSVLNAGGEWWVAESALGVFGAEDPVSLLGIVAMIEARGTSWIAPDDAIERFLSEFCYLDDSAPPAAP